MGMKISCPKNPGHNRFSVTSHITQEWSVDEHGDFQKVLTECQDVTHRPGRDDYFVCETCGTEAKVTMEEEEQQSDGAMGKEVGGPGNE